MMLDQFIRQKETPRPPGRWAAPQRIILPARGTPNPKPPVRIFVGSEPGQQRAERVLMWSIERVRDPSRVYEIHLMKELIGFDRSRWLTGFTNYRFTVPHLAGGTGRAIYNDVDQVYLADPAELFDADMGAHGFLSINDRDTSVMLIDCARLAPVWPLAAARSERRKALEARARAVPGLWGHLGGEWNARDWEYEPGRSKCVHFTTIHTQPWQPFPRVFVYQYNPIGELWHGLERSANAAGFQVYDFAAPTFGYAAVVEARTARRAAPRDAAAVPADLCAFARDLEARTLLLYAPDGTPAEMALPGVQVTRYDPAAAAPPPAGSCDGVVCLSGLEQLSAEDVPWVTAALFRCARRFVYVQVSDHRSGGAAPDGHGTEPLPRDRFWWWQHFAAASEAHPRLHWHVALELRDAAGQPTTTWVRTGGAWRDAPPRVWVLADHKVGHTTQSVGLADHLGWPYEVKPIAIDGPAGRLAPPWPDLVIATGWRCVAAARHIGTQSGGQTRLVLLGRRAGEHAEWFDLSVTCAHFRLPAHPRRIETIAPLNVVTDERLAAAASRWAGLFGDAPRPHVALLVGGSTARYRLDAATAERIGRDVAAFADAAGGTVYASTSPRTGAAATAALVAGLGPRHRVYRWRRGDPDNPYLGCLAVADVLVVTGESESMLAEAAATDKPLYIYPIPERRPGWRARVREWVAVQAYARPMKSEKGTVRPQVGREYFCARLIERGLVRARRDVAALHRNLIRVGAARAFGAPLDSARRVPLREMEFVAERVRALFGATTVTGAVAAAADVPRAARALRRTPR
jgi:hypothetical protein